MGGMDTVYVYIALTILIDFQNEEEEIGLKLKKENVRLYEAFFVKLVLIVSHDGHLPCLSLCVLCGSCDEFHVSSD